MDTHMGLVSLIHTDDPAVAYVIVWGLFTIAVVLYIYWMWLCFVKNK